MTASENTRWPVIAVVVLCAVVGASNVGKLAPALPDLRADLDMDLITGGWVASVFAIVGLVLGIASGLVGDRFGAARTLACGLVICACGGLAGAFLAASPPVLLAARVAEGLGFVLIVVPGTKLIASAAQGPARRFVYGVWGTHMPVSATLTILGAPLAIEAFGWRGLWTAIALCCLVCLIPVFRVLDMAAPRPAAGRGPSVLVRLRSVLGIRGVWMAALSFAAYTLQWISLMIWLPTYLIEAEGLAIGTAAALTAGMVAINVPGNLMGGWLLRRGVPHWLVVFIAAAIMGLSGIGIFALGAPPAAAYVLCLAFSAGGGMLPATVLSCGALFVPETERMGAANGLIVQGAHLGQLLGPPAFAAAVAHLGDWSAAVWPLAAGAGTAMVLALVLGIDERRLAKRGGGAAI